MEGGKEQSDSSIVSATKQSGSNTPVLKDDSLDLAQLLYDIYQEKKDADKIKDKEE